MEKSAVQICDDELARIEFEKQKMNFEKENMEIEVRKGIERGMNAGKLVSRTKSSNPPNSV